MSIPPPVSTSGINSHERAPPHVPPVSSSPTHSTSSFTGGQSLLPLPPPPPLPSRFRVRRLPSQWAKILDTCRGGGGFPGGSDGGGGGGGGSPAGSVAKRAKVTPAAAAAAAVPVSAAVVDRVLAAINAVSTRLREESFPLDALTAHLAAEAATPPLSVAQVEAALRAIDERGHILYHERNIFRV